MRSIFRLFWLIAVLVPARAERELPPERLQEIRSLESLPPKEALSRYLELMRFNRRFKDQAIDRLARNPGLPSWLENHFSETPVLFENLDDRRLFVTTIYNLPAEWVVRFLLKLSLDDRPMKSTRYDYDDPDFPKQMEEAQRALGDWDDTGDVIFRLYGYGPPGGDNRTLAFDGLRLMSSAALAEKKRAGEQNPSVPGTAGLSPDSPRIPEIVKGMWGNKAILNRDLGLGPDNRPLAAGSAPVERSGRHLGPEFPAAGSGTGDERDDFTVAADSGTLPGRSRLALFLACGLLAAGLATVAWRRVKAG